MADLHLVFEVSGRGREYDFTYFAGEDWQNAMDFAIEWFEQDADQCEVGDTATISLTPKKLPLDEARKLVTECHNVWPEKS